LNCQAVGPVEQGPPVPPKDIPAIITNVQRPLPIIVDAASPTEYDSLAMKTPTNKTGMSSGVPFPMTSQTAPARGIQRARSRPDLSSASTSSDSSSAPPANPHTLAAPSSGLHRRATTGSNNKTAQRRRVSRIPQMQLLPSGQWGVVDDESDEEDVGGWAKVIVTKSRYS
jgi:hypothetical protein